jgi:hypothetical protein
VLVLAALTAPAARADGDPASDYLVAQNVFVGVELPHRDAIAVLNAAVAAVYAHGDRIRVAVVATPADLGSIPSLFRRPIEYARFLGTELRGYYIGPLLVVMPGGFGIYDGGRSVAAEAAVLARRPSAGGTRGDRRSHDRRDDRCALARVSGQKTYSVRWTIPATLPSGAARLCITARDPSGHRSRRYCTGLIIRAA